MRYCIREATAHDVACIAGSIDDSAGEWGPTRAGGASSSMPRNLKAASLEKQAAG